MTQEQETDDKHTQNQPSEKPAKKKPDHKRRKTPRKNPKKKSPRGGGGGGGKNKKSSNPKQNRRQNRRQRSKGKKEKPKTFKCLQCDKEFKSEGAMLQHQRSTSHSNIAVDCPQCDEKFEDFDHLTRHMETSGHTSRTATPRTSARKEKASPRPRKKSPRVIRSDASRGPPAVREVRQSSSGLRVTAKPYVPVFAPEAYTRASRSRTRRASQDQSISARATGVTMAFRKGLVPAWESFPYGGCWIINYHRWEEACQQIDALWETVLFGLASEAFGTPEVVGASIHIRTRGYRVCIWNRDNRVGDVRFAIADKLRMLLSIHARKEIKYKYFSMSLADGSTTSQATPYQFIKVTF